jgi:hypothetical protein
VYSGKINSILTHFSAYTILVKGSRNQIQLSPDLRPLAAFISRSLRSPWCIYSSHPTSSPTLTNAAPVPGLPSKFTTPLCLLFLGRSDCVSPVSVPSFPGRSPVTSTPTNPDDWLTLPPRTGLAPMTTPVMTSNIG